MSLFYHRFNKNVKFKNCSFVIFNTDTMGPPSHRRKLSWTGPCPFREAPFVTDLLPRDAELYPQTSRAPLRRFCTTFCKFLRSDYDIVRCKRMQINNQPRSVRRKKVCLTNLFYRYQNCSISASVTWGEVPSRSLLFPQRNIFAFSAYVTISSRCCDNRWKEVELSRAKTRIAASANL